MSLHVQANPYAWPWNGDLRLVTLLTAELESDLAGDPLLPAVAWTWLADALSMKRPTRPSWDDVMGAIAALEDRIGRVLA